MKKKAAVVIPIYKEELSELELISLTQVIDVLKYYDKFLVMPVSLKCFGDHGDIEIIRFEDKWFAGSQAYSELLMRQEFYKPFEKYKYILIYQLDAFVFEDRLMYFCDLGYDYIGAPWLNGNLHFLDSRGRICYVGNGGFSLRNVSKCIELIDKTFFPDLSVNEDVFFSMANSDEFKVAPVKTALEFSFETEVRKCFEKNGKKLPFGCHAWGKYDLRFWKPYIEKFGYEIRREYLEKGNKDHLNERIYDRQREISSLWENVFLKECLNGSAEERRKIYIWGAGERGRSFGRLLCETGQDMYLAGYLDNNVQLTGSYIEKYEILPTEKYVREKEQSYIIIAMDSDRNQVAEQLEEAGCRYYRDYIFYTDIFGVLTNMKNRKRREMIANPVYS